jgi:hypothetical protein
MVFFVASVLQGSCLDSIRLDMLMSHGFPNYKTVRHSKISIRLTPKIKIMAAMDEKTKS